MKKLGTGNTNFTTKKRKKGTTGELRTGRSGVILSRDDGERGVVEEKLAKEVTENHGDDQVPVVVHPHQHDEVGDGPFHEIEPGAANVLDGTGVYGIVVLLHPCKVPLVGEGVFQRRPKVGARAFHALCDRRSPAGLLVGRALLFRAEDLVTPASAATRFAGADVGLL